MIFFVEHVETVADHRKSGLFVHGLVFGPQRSVGGVYVEPIFTGQEYYFALYTVGFRLFYTTV